MFSSFKDNIALFFEIFANLIYKKRCLICRCAKDNNLLCKNCAKSINYLSFFPHKIFNSIPIYSACIYDGVIKKLIQLLKFQHKKNSSYILAEILFKYFKQLSFKKDDFVITYPESFFLKSTSRGYNHMELITQHFSYFSNIPYYKNVIQKIKYTKPQYKSKNRKENIKDSFKINEKYIDKLKNKTILIIDDITTSGATLEEIINCFFKIGIKNLICLTISKAK